MIISDEQARLAAQYCKCAVASTATLAPHVSPEIMEQARRLVERQPDVRTDRVAEARSRMSAGPLDCHDVAHKMISRIVSDSMR